MKKILLKFFLLFVIILFSITIGVQYADERPQADHPDSIYTFANSVTSIEQLNTNSKEKNNKEKETDMDKQENNAEQKNMFSSSGKIVSNFITETSYSLIVKINNLLNK